MVRSLLARAAGCALALACGSAYAADPLPRFTEEREAAAQHFVRKYCPELTPLLDDLKRANRPAYERQVRETFQVTELLADLQDDPKRYELELKLWVAENRALVAVAKLATVKDDDERKRAEELLQVLAKELVALDVLALEHRVEVLGAGLVAAKDELAKFRENLDRATRDRFEALIERAKKKKP